MSEGAIDVLRRIARLRPALECMFYRTLVLPTELDTVEALLQELDAAADAGLIDPAPVRAPNTSPIGHSIPRILPAVEPEPEPT